MNCRGCKALNIFDRFCKVFDTPLMEAFICGEPRILKDRECINLLDVESNNDPEFENITNFEIIN